MVSVIICKHKVKKKKSERALKMQYKDLIKYDTLIYFIFSNLSELFEQKKKKCLKMVMFNAEE